MLYSCITQGNVLYMNPTSLSNIEIFYVMSVHAKEQNLSNWMAVEGGGGAIFMLCDNEIK